MHSVVLRDGGGQPSNHLSPGDDLVVDVHYEADGPDRIARSSRSSSRASTARAFSADMRLDGGQPRFIEGEGRVVCRFKDVSLLPQSYTVRMAVKAGNRDPIIDLQEVGAFTVAGDLKAFGFTGRLPVPRRRSPCRWWSPTNGSFRTESVVACGLGRGAAESKR